MRLCDLGGFVGRGYRIDGVVDRRLVIEVSKRKSNRLERLSCRDMQRWYRRWYKCPAPNPLTAT
jgi:hypothetical protein